MTDKRIYAKDAQKISNESKLAIASKISSEISLSNKFNKYFSKIELAAIEGNDYIKIIKEESDFLKYSIKRLIEFGFGIEICDETSNLQIEKLRRKISLIEEEIEEIGKETINKIEIERLKLVKFLTPHPEYLSVHDWLTDIYEGKPAIIDNWYMYQYNKLEIVNYAEKEKILGDLEPKYKWQQELRNFILTMKNEHEKNAFKIMNLWNQLNEIKKPEIYDENFRPIKPNENIEELNLYGIKVLWDLDEYYYVSFDKFNGFCSPRNLYWLSFGSGQVFLEYVDKKIKKASESGLSNI